MDVRQCPVLCKLFVLVLEVVMCMATGVWWVCN